MNIRLGGALALALVGAVLAVFFWDLEFGWFQGGPLGVALIGLAGLDVFESRRRRSGNRPRGILDEIKDELGVRPRDDRDRDVNRDPDRRDR